MKEIQKMGYSQAIIPGSGSKKAYGLEGLELLEVNDLEKFIELLG